MAILTESITVPCTSVASYSISYSLSPRRMYAKSLQFRGLTLRPFFPARSVGYVSSQTLRLNNPRGVAVVCEAQDTAAPDIVDSQWQPLVIGSETPVLVEFWAPWCGPCRMITPLIDELAIEYTGKLKCYKVNTDSCPNIASQYGVRSIPTVMIFKNGEKKDAVIGSVPKTTLISSIEKHLRSF